MQARLEYDWNHTSTLLAMLANVNRDPDKRSEPFSPMDFHPLASRLKAPAPKASIGLLKSIFVRKG